MLKKLRGLQVYRNSKKSAHYREVMDQREENEWLARGSLVDTTKSLQELAISGSISNATNKLIVM